MDYSMCKALNAPNMKGIKRALCVYDIMCKWIKYFKNRIGDSPYLQLPDDLEMMKGIGDLHVKGHVKECFPRFALMFIPGAGVIDGEIIETLWSVLNQTSRSCRGATLAHRQELLDNQMNHSNWKKLIGMGRCHLSSNPHL